MNERIVEIKARLAKATPAPWAPAVFDPAMDPVAMFKENLSYGSGDVHSVIAPEHPKSNMPDHCVTVAITGNGPTSEENRDFIVNCHDDIDYLLGVIESYARVGREKDGRIAKLYQGSEEEGLQNQIEKLKAELAHYETEEEIAELLR